jgi:hypothetical protein
MIPAYEKKGAAGSGKGDTDEVTSAETVGVPTIRIYDGGDEE